MTQSKIKKVQRAERIIDIILRKFSETVDAHNKKNEKHFIDSGISLIQTLEQVLDLDLFIELLGGTDHIFIQGRVSGFRSKSENGDEPIISHSIGEFGSKKIRGGLNYVQNKTGISQAELFLYWILRRL